MKKLLFALFAVLAVAMTSCNSFVSKSENDKVISERDSIMTEALRQGNEIAALQGTLNEMEQELDNINGQIAVSNGEDQNLMNKRNRIIQKLQILQQNLREKEHELEEMSTKYSQVIGQNKELQKTITRMKEETAKNVATIQTLESTVAEQSAKIESLANELGSTQVNLDSVQTVSAQQSEVIKEQDQMLNRGMYIVADKSTLKSLGLIEGGLFNKKRLSGKDFKDEHFTEVDIRNLSEIALGSKDAKILSTHPESSYELVKGYDKNLKLVIKDQTAFWSISHYLVVMI